MSNRLFSVHSSWPFALLALVEASLLLIAPCLALSVDIDDIALSKVQLDGRLLPATIVFALFSLISLFAVGLYSIHQRCSAAGTVVRVVTAIAIAVVLSALVFFFLPDLAMSRRTLVISAAIVVLCSLAIRTVFGRTIDEELFKRRVLVFGAGRRAACLLELRRRADSRGFRLAAFITAEGDDVAVATERLVARPPDLLGWSLLNRIDEIVVAMDDRRVAFPAQEFMECRLAGISVIELATFLERETGKLRLAVSTPSSIIFSEGFRDSSLKGEVARSIDILVSVGILALTLPVMLLTALAIFIEDGWRGGTLLYRQRRVGRYGELFDVLKFRSMRMDAEQHGAVWAAPNDPRNTRVGCFIRKTHIDELPQLINILRGEMSLVGPRPERPEFVEQFEQKLPYYRGRLSVRPGVTGWAQVCYPYGANEHDALEKLQYDLYYVKNRGVFFDLAIIMQTVEVVLWQKGAR